MNKFEQFAACPSAFAPIRSEVLATVRVHNEQCGPYRVSPTLLCSIQHAESIFEVGPAEAQALRRLFCYY